MMLLSVHQYISQLEPAECAGFTALKILDHLVPNLSSMLILYIH
jgi:hypothetical protein